MKRLLIIALLASGAWAADFSQMSTEQMMNMRGSVPIDDRPAFQQEMQKRMQSMSPHERQTYMQRNKGMGQGQGMMGQGKGMGQGMGMGQKRMMNQPQFTDYDLNNDGAISENEFQEARAKRMNQRTEEGKMLRNAGNAPSFADIDTNKDGTLSQEEFQSHQAQQMQNKGNRAGQGMGRGRNF